MSNIAAKRGRPRVLTDEQRKLNRAATLRKWRAKNPHKNADDCKARYIKNRERRLAYAAEYRAKKKAEASHA